MNTDLDNYSAWRNHIVSLSSPGHAVRKEPERLTWCKVQVDAEQWRADKAAELVVLPERIAVPLPCSDLPELVLAAIAAVQVRIRQLPAGSHLRCSALCFCLSPLTNRALRSGCPAFRLLLFAGSIHSVSFRASVSRPCRLSCASRTDQGQVSSTPLFCWYKACHSGTALATEELEMRLRSHAGASAQQR